MCVCPCLCLWAKQTACSGVTFLCRTRARPCRLAKHCWQQGVRKDKGPSAKSRSAWPERVGEAEESASVGAHSLRACESQISNSRICIALQQSEYKSKSKAVQPRHTETARASFYDASAIPLNHRKLSLQVVTFRTSTKELRPKSFEQRHELVLSVMTLVKANQ